MTLKCQWKGAKCPPYKHDGVFETTNEILTRFEPDLNRCAKCIAYAKPQLPSFQDDLLQIARITLCQKGPSFDPNHAQKASFRTYMLPRICGALTNAKTKEIQHYGHFIHPPSEEAVPNGTSEVSTSPQGVFLPSTSCREGNFENTLVWEMWNADFEQALPRLLKCLTKREHKVFSAIRSNMKQCDISETLGLSRPRVSQLLKQVELKLTRECRHIGIIE
ncbi:sigma-70 family RNA polymerase sigma factor [Candidatus Poribacteria bacterium]|nr:sigma-70 family RNA polymerase sigma factor [Candidatus Poribacteria bacterium]MYK16848.1 sigma-70 family RNA polymerase sigma factor [Candidatus Poribacteria bacterium]